MICLASKIAVSDFLSVVLTCGWPLAITADDDDATTEAPSRWATATVGGMLRARETLSSQHRWFVSYQRYLRQ